MECLKVKNAKNLELEWIYGYRAKQCRNNVQYIGLLSEEIVYFVAKLGIVLNVSQHRQRYFYGHNKEIICLTQNTLKCVVATGQMGPKAYTCIWDPRTMETVSVLLGRHYDGISAMDFDDDGSRLVTIGAGNRPSVVIWDWLEGRILGRSTEDTPILSARFLPQTNSNFVTCGLRHVKFWNHSGNVLEGHPGSYDRKGVRQTMLCVTHGSGGYTYTGNLAGDIYVWKSGVLQSILKDVHPGGVISIHRTLDINYVTGGKDGFIQLWDQEFRPSSRINLGILLEGSKGLSIRSVHSQGEDKVLVGTSNHKIVEVTNCRGHPEVICHVNGHCNTELTVLAVHPSRPIFVTGSADCILRMWQMFDRRLLNEVATGSQILSSDFNPDGSQLAVSLKSGAIVILKISDLYEMKVFQEDSKSCRILLKHAPDGTYLAAANDAGEIQIHSVYKDYRILRRWCIPSGTSITSIDWSIDSRHILVNDANRTRYVYNFPEGIQISTANEVIVWSTWTGILGTEVTGLWSKYDDKCDIVTTDVDFHGGIMVTGSVHGKLGWLPFPSFVRGVKQKSHRIHSSMISAVRFSCDKTRVISIGKDDHAILQWKFVQACVNNLSKVESDEFNSDEDEDCSCEAELDSDLESELLLTYDRKYSKEQIWEENRKSVSIIDNQKGKGQRNASIEGLKLKYVFGYRGFDCRNNLYFTRAGAIVYHVASVGIVHHLDTHYQKHYVHHTDDILCLALHPYKDYVATGQASSTCPIHVWDCETTRTLSILKCIRQCSIRAIDFLSDGKRLASIGWDKKCCVIIWNWKKGELIGSSWGYGNEIFVVKCDPWESLQFVTVGVRLRFWRLCGNGCVYKIPESEYDKQKFEKMVSVSFVKSQHSCITGGSSGTVYIWERHFLVRTIKCHDEPVFTLLAFDQGILTAGKDGSVQLWNENMERCLKVLSLGPGKRMAIVKAAHVAHGSIVIGTNANEIMLLDKSGRTQIIVQGNCINKPGSLAAHPNKNQVSTVGNDRTLRVWDLDSFQMVSNKILSQNDFCVAYSTSGKYMAVGSTEGNILILVTETMDALHEWNHRKISVSMLKFSPEDSLFAVGYMDDVVDVYLVGKWKWLSACHTCLKPPASITHLDWSQDGTLMHVNTLSGDSFVFEASSGSLLNLIPQQVKWSTWTASAGLNCDNIWAISKGDISATCRSADEKLLAVCDVYGFLRFLAFPIMIKYPKCKWYTGHGPSVADIQWLCDGRTLVSSNGTDSAILVWNRTALIDRKSDFDSDESDSDDMEDGFECQVGEEMISSKSTNQYRKPQMDYLVQGSIGSEIYNDKRKFSLQSKVKLKHSEDGNGVFQVSRLNLVHVIGYNGHGNRGNVHYINDGREIVYPATSIGVVLNTITGNQTFYFGHTDTITCLAINEHPEHQALVGTGQLGGNPSVNVWSMDNLCTRSWLNVGHDDGIVALDFSPVSGISLVIVGMDPQHTITVWNWKTGITLASKCAGSRMILAVKFRPDDESRFVTVGQCNITFWTVVGSKLLAQKGCMNVGEDNLSGNVTTKSMLSITFGKNNVTYTGTANGSIFVWKAHFLQRVIVKAHTGPIYTMHLSLRDGLITTGSREIFGARLDDAGVKVWDPDMKRCRPFLIRSKEKEILIKSVSRSKGKIIVGSSINTIHELTEQTGFVREVHQSHGPNGIWGLALHGQLPLAATSGGDCTLRIWDVCNRRVKNCLHLDSTGSSVHFSAVDNDILAVGQRSGEFLLVDITTMKIMTKRRDTDSPITDVKIDPFGKYLAVTDERRSINIYCINQGCTLVRLGYYRGPSSNNNLFVDYAIDGKRLMVINNRTNSVILTVPECCLLSDVERLESSSLSTISTLPIHTTELCDGKAIWSSAISSKRDWIIAGNDLGEIKLFQIVQNEIQDREHNFHVPSHFCSKVGFSHDDQYVITTGGHDCSILIWKLSHEHLGT